MPIRLNSRMIGSVTATDLSGMGASHPKYAAMITAMNAQSTRMNLPWVIK